MSLSRVWRGSCSGIGEMAVAEEKRELRGMLASSGGVQLGLARSGLRVGEDVTEEVELAQDESGEVVMSYVMASTEQLFGNWIDSSYESDRQTRGSFNELSPGQR